MGLVVNSSEVIKLEESNEWLNKELAACKFGDERLEKRFKLLCGQLWSGLGNPIPFACQDWANTKAAYRFFSNSNISELEILHSHFQSTKERFVKNDNVVLVLHDTTEFSYQRDNVQTIGMTHLVDNGQKDKCGRPQKYTVCGILMHSSLVLTTEGLPLGLASVKFWTRKKFKGCNELKRHINPTRVPIEEKESHCWLSNVQQATELLSAPEKCIHIGDRGGDIYELYCKAKELDTHFLVRTCVDRLAEDGKRTINQEMENVEIKGFHRIEVPENKGKTSEATLEIRCKRIQVLPPIGKQKKYPALALTVIYAEEKNPPDTREKVVWKLITNLDISSYEEAIEKLNWYALRWKIEVFHKILKSGCRSEDLKLRTADRLAKAISVFCILSWRIFWMTMINRNCQNASPHLALTATEIQILDSVDKGKSENAKDKTLSDYLLQIAKLGGYLARASDPPPGNIVMWRGIQRLTDMQFGFSMANS
jgi:hypothetical protein